MPLPCCSPSAYASANISDKAQGSKAHQHAQHGALWYLLLQRLGPVDPGSLDVAYIVDVVDMSLPQSHSTVNSAGLSMRRAPHEVQVHPCDTRVDLPVSSEAPS